MTLQTEIHQTRPFASLHEEADLNIMRTSELIQLALARLFRPRGLSLAQYNILRILRGAGAGGLSGCVIRERLLACVPDLTRLIDRLEQAGWVRRRRSEEDRRMVFIAITPSGLDLLTALDPLVEELHRSQMAHLSDAELREIVALMTRARESFLADGSTPPPESCSP
jgi:DNA-binding MarR family transcriptional regulator